MEIELYWEYGEEEECDMEELVGGGACGVGCIECVFDFEGWAGGDGGGS